ncbi:MAG: hypothetical protein ACE5K1_05535 [Acidiferrobacterales bacterium]
MIVRFQPNAQIEWRAYRDTETDGWVAVCDALGRSAAGDTWDRLCATIFDLQHALLMDLLIEGELASFLRHRGWHIADPLPERVPDGGVTFDVPTTITHIPGVNVTELHSKPSSASAVN